jgi:hypothetical protein
MEFKFTQINEVDKKPDIIFNPIGLLTPFKGDSSYSRGYKKLYLLVNVNEPVELKYNISDDADLEFVEKLKRLANQTK